MKLKSFSELPVPEEKPTPVFVLQGGPFVLSSPIRFGKYRSAGLTLGQLIDSDPEYVRFCAEHVVGFILTPGAKAALEDALGGGPDNRDESNLDD